MTDITKNNDCRHVSKYYSQPTYSIRLSISIPNILSMIPKLILTGITFCTAFLFILPEQKASWHLISKTHSREAIAEEIADYVNEISHNKK